MNLKTKLYIILSIVIALAISIDTIRAHFMDEERQVRSQVRETIINTYPEKAEKLMSSYGLKPFDTAHPKNAKQVILIHGIDDPNKAWMNLAPALAKSGFAVKIMLYPNDQPISESAHFFQNQLQNLYKNNPKSLSIVAHSMGGLVAREMLTAPTLAYADKVKNGQLPKIDQLIMVGTPNHGSEMARFRFFSELREQFIRITRGDYYWLQFFVDGAGEAGIDLMPKSTFLTELNSRPHPKGIELLVIAGLMSVSDKTNLKDLIKSLGLTMSEDVSTLAKPIEALIHQISNTIGDGLVTTSSARLPKVAFITISGTHLSIIRNIFPASKRIPPAVPIIVKQLKN